MSKGTRNNLLMTFAVLAIVLAVFIFMVVRLWGAKELVKEQRSILAQEQETVFSDYQLQRVSDQTDKARNSLQSRFLLDESDSVNFVTAVESLASSQGIELRTSNLNLLENKRSSEKWIETKFELEGDLDDVYNFLLVLETMPYVTRLMEVKMGGDDTLWSAMVVIRVRLLQYEK